MTDIAKRITEELRRSNLSYAELSEMTGISKSALQRYATGKTEKIPLDRLKRIAEALGVTPSYVLGWDGEIGSGTKEVSVIPGRLWYVFTNDPESKHVRIDIKAADQEALEIGLNSLNSQGIDVASLTPQALILTALEKLNYEGQQKAVERIQELTEIPKYQI